MKIEFIRPSPRIEDWRVKCCGVTSGSVWRTDDGRYIANCTHAEYASTVEAAFKLARKQVKSIAAASRLLVKRDAMVIVAP